MNASDPNPQPDRDGCLTTWLVLMVIAGTWRAVSPPFAYDAIKQIVPGATWPVIVILSALGFASIVFAIALFRWRKWGFFGFAVAKLTALGVHLTVGYKVAEGIFGLVGIGILCWVLHIGGSHKAWPRLR